MRRSEKARLVIDILNKEYPDQKPLLNYETPFQLLIAVILSAQTTDAGVNKVTPLLFKFFPDAASLAKADTQQIEGIIKPTGFFRVKAKNIIMTAQILKDAPYQLGIPETLKDLIALPGVGRKTANVILHHIFNKPAIIVDTHFKRVSNRLGFTKLTDPTQIEKELKRVIPQKYQSALSMTLNFHGRQYCFARKPNCGSCPISSYCEYIGPQIKK